MTLTTARPGQGLSSGAPHSLFEQASNIFDGWRDETTGLRVLRVATNDTAVAPGVPPGLSWRTTYHQYLCFLDGGRKVLLRTGDELRGVRTSDSHLLDLTTGEVSNPFPAGYYPIQVHPSGLAILYGKGGFTVDMVLWDLRADRALTVLPHDGWGTGWSAFLCDGRRAIFAHFQGEGGYYGHYRSRFFLVGDDGSCEQIMADDGAICNHIQGHPTDPNLYAYDRWPTPYTHTPQVIRLRTLDGASDEPLPLKDGVLAPGHILGGQRDHFLWTPDGARIASYLTPRESTEGCADHFEFGWHISAMDWRTGEDLCVPYPEHRWGCNFTVTPNARYVVSAGGKGFQYLYLIDIEGLQWGWNERMLCAFPFTEVDGDNDRLFHMPWVLPDGSGVLFTAGWYTPANGVYLVESPEVLA